MIVDYTDGGEPVNPYRRMKTAIRTPAQERKDWREQRQSWRGINNIHKMLKTFIAAKTSGERRSSRIMASIRSKADAARKRFQTHFMNRLERLIAETKERNSSPSSGALAGGLLGGAGVLAGLLAMKALTSSINALRWVGLKMLRVPRVVGGGVGKVGTLAAGLAGAGFHKLMQTRAGAMMGMAYNSAKALLTPAGIAAMSTRARTLLMTTLSRALPSTIVRLVTGPAGIIASVGFAAKWVWDAVLPTSWKREIEYHTAKSYLKAIEKMTQVFEWVGKYWTAFSDKLGEWKKRLEDFKNGVSNGVDEALSTTSGFFSFVGSAITTDGPERDSIVQQWRSIVDSVSKWFGGLTEWVDKLIKPFYVNGEFSLKEGLKAYKSRYDEWRRELDDTIGGTIDMAIQNAKGVVDTAKNKASEVASNISPTNLAAKAEATVKARESRARVHLADEIDGKEVFNGYVENENGMWRYNGSLYTDEGLQKAIVTDLNAKRSLQLGREGRWSTTQTATTKMDSIRSAISSWTNSTDPIKIFADFFSPDRIAKAYQDAIQESVEVKQSVKEAMPKPSASNTAQPSVTNSFISRPNLSETNPHINSFPRGLV